MPNLSTKRSLHGIYFLFVRVLLDFFSSSQYTSLRRKCHWFIVSIFQYHFIARFSSPYIVKAKSIKITKIDTSYNNLHILLWKVISFHCFISPVNLIYPSVLADHQKSCPSSSITRRWVPLIRIKLHRI